MKTKKLRTKMSKLWDTLFYSAVHFVDILLSLIFISVETDLVLCFPNRYTLKTCQILLGCRKTIRSLNFIPNCCIKVSLQFSTPQIYPPQLLFYNSVGNMLADYVRTGTYQKAMYNNSVDFTGKVVLDVGTGTGILAYFAVQAGAARVYAVDASDSLTVARKLIESNGFGDKIVLVKGKIEEVTLPEQVDIIVSEPIGFLLVHERMLESYVAARDRFLKPGGLMMPTAGSIVLCPFTDDVLYKEHCARAAFWETTNFYGINLSAAAKQAQQEYFSQAIVGYVDPTSLLSNQRTVHTIDFSVVSCEDLRFFIIPFSFKIEKTGNLAINLDVIMP